MTTPTTTTPQSEPPRREGGFTVTLDDVRRALALSEADGFDGRQAQWLMSPNPRPTAPPQGMTAKQSAVLLLLYEANGELNFPLMRRAEYPGVHSGQISLPGGKQEEGESFEQTALREAHEEVGIHAADVQIVGELTALYVPPSNFEIHPVVGVINYKPDWTPDPTEVAQVIEVSISALFDDSLKGDEVVDRGGMRFTIRYYLINGHKVWGATAVMLGELETRLRTVMPPAG